MITAFIGLDIGNYTTSIRHPKQENQSIASQAVKLLWKYQDEILDLVT